MSASDKLMPGPEGKIPRFYEVDKGHKTESYLTAISHNPIPPQTITAQYDPIELAHCNSTVMREITEMEKVAEEVTVDTPLQKRPGTIGLTEAELQQYRDDPFWKTLRWILFALFWLLWILMFLAAILLVIFSPGCVVQIRPNWWQTAVAYNVWVPSFQDSDGDGMGDFEGLIGRLENLRKSGVQTVWPSPFLLSDDFSNAVRDYRAIDSKLGVNTVADKLIDEVHSKGMKIVINLPIATTSTEHDWFLRSAQASKAENKNYSDFYYWTPKNPAKDHFASHKNLFYLHESGNEKSAVLNWQNKNVRQHMFEILSNWIDRKIDGFHLTGVEYLSRTANFVSPNWRGVQDVIRDIRNHVDGYVKESSKVDDKERKIALFTSAEGAREKDKKSLAVNGLDTVINYELTNVEKNTKVCHISEGTVATCTHEILADVILFHSLNKEVWPQWEFSNQHVSRLSTRAGSRSHSELLLMLQLMLPGTNAVYYGEEIGMRDIQNDTKVPPQRSSMQWDDTVNGGFSSNPNPVVPVHSDYPNINWKRQWSEEKSPLKMYSKLSKLRQRDDTLMSGESMMGRLIGHSFTLTRFYQNGNETTGQIYVAAVNFGRAPISLPLDDLPNNEGLAKTQIVTTTSNCLDWLPRQSIDLSSKQVTVSPEQGLVFRYSAV